MSEITLGDVLAWHHKHFETLNPEMSVDVLSRSVSWAESIRATVPVLPRLRGDEIILIPSRTLEELKGTENISWSEISSFLRGQPIAAVVVDSNRVFEWPSRIPALKTSPSFLETAEIAINRSITERRSELFRIGSDLARALSVLSLSGGGVAAVLNVAEKISGVSMLLVDSRSHIVSRAPRARQGPPEKIITEPLLVSGAAFGYQLIARTDGNAGADICRLVLSQTSQQLGLLVDRGKIELPPGDRQPDTEQLLRHLLIGTNSSPASNLDINLLPSRIGDRAVRVALITSVHEQLANRVSGSLPPDLLELGAVLEPDEYALILPEGDRSRYLNPLQEFFKTFVQGDATARLAISGAALDTDELPGLYQDAKALSQLMRAGVLVSAVADDEDQISNGVEGLLYRYWRHDVGEMASVRRQLSAVSDNMLEKLETRDNRQDSNLVDTLDAYLRAGGVTQIASKKLGIHRNTMAYRLMLIQTVTGHDLSDPETQTLYRIALAIRNLETILQ